MEIVVGDARKTAERTPDRVYDVIITEVFAGAAMPVHLGTVEFARELRRVLRPGGSLVTNQTRVPRWPSRGLRCDRGRRVRPGGAPERDRGPARAPGRRRDRADRSRSTAADEPRRTAVARW
ncbi:spermidine synthase [Actinoplanes regularis]|uniref:spermidine synthase n=1 Tax=Actinoplanes regularis TaxID=52697 RepID=UPI003D7FD1BB